MEDFEDDLKIALTRIKRSELKAMLQEHEEASFDAETKAAFNRIERDRLKKKLIEHAEGSGGGIPEVASIGSKSPFNNYLKFAAAACVVFGLSFYFIYPSYRDEPTLAESTPIKNDSVVKSKTEDLNVKNKDAIKKSSQIENTNSVKFAISIKSENLGFGLADKLKGKIIIDKTVKGVYSSWFKDFLTLKSDKDIKIKSVINYQGNMYININTIYYLIKPNTTSTPIIPLTDEELIKNLNKIDLTK
jgi:hypothetical protein